MNITKVIKKLSLPHNSYKYGDKELHTFLSILMPDYQFKTAFDIRGDIDDYDDTIDNLFDLIGELVKLAKTNQIEDMQRGFYSSYDVDGIEDNEYYIDIVAYKMKE